MKVMVFGGIGESTNAVVNALSKEYDVEVIIEKPVPKITMLKRRIKRLGISTVLGQMLFMIMIPPYLKKKSKARIDEIKILYELDTAEISTVIKEHHVESINSSATLEIVRKQKPDIIVVNGTRIISKEILKNLEAPIINMHMGITPKYRGVHGGYWAVANNDKENFGVTIHKVDEGIDTGNVIAQKRITTKFNDNYVTYPYIQMGEGICLEKKVLHEYMESGKINAYEVDLPSAIWSHPTLRQYLRRYKVDR